MTDTLERPSFVAPPAGKRCDVAASSPLPPIREPIAYPIGTPEWHAERERFTRDLESRGYISDSALAAKLGWSDPTPEELETAWLMVE